MWKGGRSLCIVRGPAEMAGAEGSSSGGQIQQPDSSGGQARARSSLAGVSANGEGRHDGRMGRGGMMGNSALQRHLAEADRHSNGVSANKVPSSSSPLQPNGCLVFGISPLKQACDSEKITRWFA